MQDIDKLKVLLPHWIEHNTGHESECSKWADMADEAGLKGVALHIRQAVEAMKKANEELGHALREAGGPAEEGHHHHHYHHHHD